MLERQSSTKSQVPKENKIHEEKNILSHFFIEATSPKDVVGTAYVNMLNNP